MTTTDTATSAGSAPLGRRQAEAGRVSLLGKLAADPLALTGLVIVVVFALVALGASWLAPHDPLAVHPTDRLLGSTATYPLGTDALGRDLLSRLLYGGRWSMGLAAVAMVLVMLIGVSVGIVAGYIGGRVDQLLMRVVDVLLGFPSLLLALAIAGTLGPGIDNVLLGLVVVWWVDYARVVRGITLTIREQEFVEAGQAMGASTFFIMRQHILPNVVPPVVVLATLETGTLILALAGLNFLGLGIQPPNLEWGAMINESRRYLTSQPHLVVYPGLTITAVVMGFNLLGDGLRDVFDPWMT